MTLRNTKIYEFAFFQQKLLAMVARLTDIFSVLFFYHGTFSNSNGKFVA